MKATPQPSRFEKRLEVAVVAAALAPVPPIVAQERGSRGAVVAAVDRLIWAVFAVGVIARIGVGASTGCRPRFLRSSSSSSDRTRSVSRSGYPSAQP